MNETLKMVSTLVVISLFSALILSIAYGKTSPLIKENKLGELKKSLKEVFPDASYFEETQKPIEAEAAKISSAKKSKERIEKIINAFDEDKNKIGIVVLSSKGGFQGYIKVLTGIDMKNKKITKIKIMEQTETPGLGARIEEPAFLGQFSNRPIEEQKFGKIDAITGATISSKAVINSVKNSISEILDIEELE